MVLPVQAGISFIAAKIVDDVRTVPPGDLAVYCKQFFDIGYAVRGGKISVEDPRGWLEVLP
ncbi:MAG: hypothetical protein PWP58_1533 [Bacillota bacterium]|jgi:hypothetical protein|nr:hypothetical protein [Bacillota bacterium]MDK2883197.1 hypothetical protein [Bacillota bacterium]